MAYSENSYFARKQKERERAMEELNKLIRDEVKRELNLRVRKTEFQEFTEEDGTPIVTVDVWLRKEDKKIKDDLFVRLIPLVANTVRRAGEFKAFPLIIPHIARGQEIQSKLLKSR